MKKGTAVLVVASVLGLIGCGGQAVTAPMPLTVAEWSALPVEQKYSAVALERLKLGNPELQTAAGWEAFSRTTLAENWKKDRLVRSSGVGK